MGVIANLIDRVLAARGEPGIIESARGEVRSLCEQFPIYE